METQELELELELAIEQPVTVEETNGYEVHKVHKEVQMTVPDVFIYEMWDGKPVYYRGYKECLDNPETFERCMGSSVYQSLVVTTLVVHLHKKLPKSYVLLTNELGVLLKKKDWRSADIAICEKAQIDAIAPGDKMKYLHIAPKVIIEIDTKADVSDFNTSMDYYTTKTQNLLDFGVERVIWIFTGAKKIMTATKNSPWHIVDWDESIEILDGIAVSLSDDLML
jgi:hypothetical protein